MRPRHRDVRRQVVETGSAEQVFGTPRHPYTLGLLQSVPRLDTARGAAAAADRGHRRATCCSRRTRCPFAPRCRYAVDESLHEVPQLVEVEPGHFVACFNPVPADDMRSGRGRCTRVSGNGDLVELENLQRLVPDPERRRAATASRRREGGRRRDALRSAAARRSASSASRAAARPRVGRAILRLYEPTSGHGHLRRPGHHAPQRVAAASDPPAACRWSSRIRIASLNPRHSVGRIDRRAAARRTG